MDSEGSKMVLGVDLDGVCADFYGKMREIASEWFECSLEDLTTDVSYGFKEWGIETQEQYNSLHRFAVTQRDLFKRMDIIPGARKYLRKLSDDGYRIRIITHRLFIHYFHAAAVKQTIEWLDTHAIPYWDLCFMRAKDQVGADIYIEDAPHNIMRLRSKGFHTICFANSTNVDVEAPRGKNWKEVYEMVKSYTRESSGPSLPGLEIKHE
ncbi:5'-nucleotidase [Lentisphaerota bacterium ZTH]|nr:5'-nucleotidase [Lentisphaerota bacterium]WET07189.1 5'-nucleotidase [Lentisphaerota bacterium ZTH]